MIDTNQTAPTKTVSKNPNKTSAAATKSVQKKADEFSDALHAKFMSLLNAKIEEKGGHLTPDDVTQMGDEFQRNLGDIQTVFMDAVESFSRAQMKARDGNERGNVFVRLMVNKFEHQFVPDRHLNNDADVLSRRMLPGFQNALKTMVGTQKQAEFEKSAKSIVRQHQESGDGEVDWTTVFQSSSARMIALGAQIEIARHFQEAEKRIDWLVAMVNSNMISIESKLAGADWQFTRDAALKLLSLVFTGLHDNLNNQNTREKIIRKLGPDMIVQLDKVAERFH